MEREDDVQLIRRVLSGDDKAFDILVAKYQKSVHALVWRKVEDFHYAEEITQDTFLQAYRKLSTLKNPHQFAGWLYVIANRLCIDWIRKQKPAMQSLEETSVKEIDSITYERYVEEDRELEAAEHRHEIVKKLLEKLPESERTVMTLYYLGEMTTKEISKFLGVSVKTISSRLRRARERLKQKEDLFVQEYLGGVQLSANIRQNIARKVVDLKPTPSPKMEPFLPWAAFGTAVVLATLLMLSVSNQYLAHFQKPYSFEAESEPTIEIIDAPIVLDIDAKPALRNQMGQAAVLGKSSRTGLQAAERDSTLNASEDSLRLSATQWMPDAALRQAVREKLAIPADIPLTRAYLQQHLTSLDVRYKGIVDLTGLEHATDLQALVLIGNKIQNISPLSGLTGLAFLDLGENQISDLRPLAILTRLETLHIWKNQIEDISPLTGLVNLKKLLIENNDIRDFSPLDGLTHLEELGKHGNFRVSDDISRVAVAPRIKDRDYPSVFSAWYSDVLNLPNLSDDEKLVYHDLFWGGPGFHLQWHPTSKGLRLFGRIDDAHWKSQYLLSQNPNFTRLVSLDYIDADPSDYPEEWPHWIKDENGDRVQAYAGGSTFLIDFTHPVVQDLLIQKALAVAKCGLYDGIFLGRWEEGTPTLEDDKGAYYRGVEAEWSARLSMVRRIREAVGDNFLIVVNMGQTKSPLSAPYVNGAFIETILDEGDTTYTHDHLREIESTLLWSEQNLREPQINALEGRGIPLEPPDSPRNQQMMRVITTLGLTHSDGYVCYVVGISGIIHKHAYQISPGHEMDHIEGEPHQHNHQHYWYPFWDADLGQPIVEKSQLYQNREGVFIREFTKGWAVYNRSGTPQKIQLMEQTTGVASGITGTQHILPDLDGEIYLK